MTTNRHVIPNPRPYRDVTIEVTQDLIDRGCQGDADNCPEALAILVHLKPGLIATVTGGTAYIYQMDPETGAYVFDKDRDAELAIIRQPNSAIMFVRTFDAGQPVQPFTYTLSLPVDVLRED